MSGNIDFQSLIVFGIKLNMNDSVLVGGPRTYIDLEIHEDLEGTKNYFQLPSGYIYSIV